ncbi:MAG: hypothetical protein JF606_29065 [Burkholderiales bacterium]|jgi:hypothetical protein|nr:hypothetical protein [Burkholderiales bacterium]
MGADPDALRMEWTDLRSSDPPEAAAYTRLWKDKLDSAQRKWQASPQKGRPLPAFTLGHTFGSATPPVLVNILFDLYDCELPGNGAGAPLFARCPMRVVTGPSGATRVKTIERVCYLYVPPIAKSGDGPDPAKNFTTVALDASRTLHVRVYQFGHRVRSCDGDYAVE